MIARPRADFDVEPGAVSLRSADVHHAAVSRGAANRPWGRSSTASTLAACRPSGCASVPRRSGFWATASTARRSACRSRGPSRSPARSTCTSGVLTLVHFTMPADPTQVLLRQQQLGRQQEPYRGDVFNSYNDGPPEPGQAGHGRLLRAGVALAGRAVAHGQVAVAHALDLSHRRRPRGAGARGQGGARRRHQDGRVRLAKNRSDERLAGTEQFAADPGARTRGDGFGRRGTRLRHDGPRRGESPLRWPISWPRWPRLDFPAT